MATPTVADPGDHVSAQILTYRGVIDTGDPWDVTGGGVKAAASTSVTVTGVTTNVADTLIVQAVARDNDSSASSFSQQTNANLTSITERSDGGTGSGNGGGFAVWDGVKAGAGATGDTTATVTSSINAFLTIALRRCGSVTDASYAAASAQSTQVTVYWSSANPVLILRKSNSSITDTPGGGTTYSVGNSIDLSKVVYSGSVVEKSFLDTGQTAGRTTTDRYKVFVKAAGSCYSPGLQVDASAPSGTAWGYVLAGGSMLKPGIAGEGALYASGQAGRIVSLSTATGTQNWQPVATNAAVQGWLTWLPVQGGWQFRKKITIDGTKVGSGGVSDFPVLISITDANLSANAQANGNDILFTASDGSTRLSHEIEKYTSATGELIAWVKVPSLSSASNTDIYMYYGNSAASNQQDAANVWDANFMAVWHLKEDPSGPAPQMKDSTVYANHASSSGNMTLSDQVAGQIDGSIQFGGPADTDDFVAPPDATSLKPAQITVEAWVNPTSLTSPTNWPIAAIKTTGTAWTDGWGIVRYDPASFPALPSNNINFFINSYSANYATGTLTVGAWSHVVGTYDGSTIKLYVNGALAGSRAYTAAINHTTEKLTIARDTLGNPWNGLIDEVHIANVARSAAWITTAYNNQGSPSTFYSVGAQEVGASRIVVGGDQSGRVDSVEAVGVKNWEVALTGADAVQAGVSAQVRAWSNADFQAAYTGDVIFAATWNASNTSNKVFALKAGDGTSAGWTFNANGTDYSVDYIAGQPYVDYARNRIYVASRAGSLGGQQSLWVIKTVDGELVLKGQPMACPACTVTNRHFETSPTLSYDGNTLYIGATDGTLYAINAGALTLKWTLAVGSKINTAGFVWEDYTTPGRLYFTTADDKVRCVKEKVTGDGADPCAVWPAELSLTVVPGASTPLLLDKLFVGSSDGKVHQINLGTGVDEKQFPAASTLDGTQVGAVSTETGNEIFVGTSGGKIFKINLTSGALP